MNRISFYKKTFPICRHFNFMDKGSQEERLLPLYFQTFQKVWNGKPPLFKKLPFYSEIWLITLVALDTSSTTQEMPWKVEFPRYPWAALMYLHLMLCSSSSPSGKGFLPPKTNFCLLFCSYMFANKAVIWN